MARKKHKSKPSANDPPDITARETATAASSILQPFMSTKNDLSDDANNVTASDRSKKRRKINSNTGLHHHDPPSSNIPVTTLIENIHRPESANGTSTQELPPEVRHLSTKYNFTTMSILSSSKINDKVERLLLQVENFSFADPKSKPGVVVLHAKSDVANKMVSIVGIAQQEIERDKGKWWQYSKLDEQLTELKVKPAKRRDGGKTLSEWQKEQAGNLPQGVKEAGDEPGHASGEVVQNHQSVNGDEEMEDAFETMENVKEVVQAAKQSKIRAIPVMTIYFARVPVPGLKELFGYVLVCPIEATL